MKLKTCTCGALSKCESAAADLLRERDEWKRRYNLAVSAIEGHVAQKAELKAENERLRNIATQRGARMQIMRDWMRQRHYYHHSEPWSLFVRDRPEARDWFDFDGVPIDAAMEAERDE